MNADEYIFTSQGIIGFNRYAYCLNDPINSADYSGNICGPIIIAGVIIATLLLTSCTPDTESLVGTDADPAPDVSFSDRNKAIQEACDTAYTGMMTDYYDTGIYFEYAISVFRYVPGGAHDPNVYYVSKANTYLNTTCSYHDERIIFNPELEIVALIHTHPNTKPNNTDYIFNEQDDYLLKRFNCDQFVVENDGGIYLLPKGSSNFTNEKEWGTAADRSTNKKPHGSIRGTLMPHTINYMY